jgi:hypothetical protein|tara:strand:+ start:26 stop:529 length:504 start_codon:yes stop_codon:yes gene_type:complete
MVERVWLVGRLELVVPQNGGGKGWVFDPESGSQVMPDSWNLFLEWLLLGHERKPVHQYQWAEENSIHEDSLRRWKRDPRFIREWDRRASEVNVSPERVQGVVDALWARAAEGDVKAAGLYLQYVDKFTPKRRVVVDDDRDASGLSDVELADELEAEVRLLRVVGSDG